MDTMLRDLIRTIRDVIVRANVTIAQPCAGCGGELGNWTYDCRHCEDRFLRRDMRGTVDGAWYAREHAMMLAFRAQERERRSGEGETIRHHPGRIARDPYYFIY